VIDYLDGRRFHSAHSIPLAQSCRPPARRQESISNALLPSLCPTLNQEKWFTMPRLRGKPRRGAAWYRAASRRKYLQRFEKILALASTRRRKRARRLAMAMVEPPPVETAMVEPAMAMVEPAMVEPAMAMVEAHHAEHSGQKDTLKQQLDAAEENYYPPCLIEEEIPQSPEPVPGTNQEGTEAATAQQSTADKDGPPVKEVSAEEETMSPATGENYTHPSLIFELRSMLDDLNFRVASTNQRMNMLLSALSTTAPRQQCPTCAKKFWIPAGWRHADCKQANPGPG
jgi:hypothetical protein